MRKEEYERDTSLGLIDLGLSLVDFNSDDRKELGDMKARDRQAYVASRLSQYDITELRIEGHAYPFKSFKTAATLRSMFGDMAAKIGKPGIFTYKEPSAGTTATSRPSATENAPAPAANFYSITTKSDVTRDGVKGRKVICSLKLSGMKGKQTYAYAYFYHFDDGKPLKDLNREFYSPADGNVVASHNFTPDYDACSYPELTIFIPYDELHQGSGQHDVQTRVGIYDPADKKWLGFSNYAYFRYESDVAPAPSSAENAPTVDTHATLSQNDRVSSVTADVTNVKTKHNITQSGAMGMQVTFAVDISGMKGKLTRAYAYFYFEDGKRLMDMNRNFYSPDDGGVAVSGDFTPLYADSAYPELYLFIPYDELHLASGKHNLKAYVAIYDAVTGVELGNSEYTHFRFQR